NSLIVGSEGGSVFRVNLHDGAFTTEKLFQIEPHRSSGKSNFDLQIKDIASIIVKDDRVILSYVRDTYDRRPPMTCFSLQTGQKLWDAGRVQTASKDSDHSFGNSRVTPALWNNLVISTFSYNESVHAFAMSTGKWIWRVRLDESYF